MTVDPKSVAPESAFEAAVTDARKEILIEAGAQPSFVILPAIYDLTTGRVRFLE